MGRSTPHQLFYLPQVRDEPFPLAFRLRPVRDPQEVGRVHGRQHARPVGQLGNLAAHRADVVPLPARLATAVAPSATISFGFTNSRSRSSQNLHAFPSPMFGRWCSRFFAARHELEVLHRIGDIGALAVDTGLRYRRVEHVAGRTDEWLPGQIFRRSTQKGMPDATIGKRPTLHRSPLLDNASAVAGYLPVPRPPIWLAQDFIRRSP